MTKISLYNNDSTISDDDKVLGTDSSGSVTKNYPLSSLLSYIESNISVSNGADGADGDSAYDIWISLGNSGTEQDFIDSLQGADGADATSSYNVITGTITQTSTNNPVLTVYENTSGQTLTTNRNTTGYYEIAFSGGAVSGQGICFINGSSHTGTFNSVSAVANNPSGTTTNGATIFSFDNTNALADGILTDVAFEIRIYGN